MGCERVGGKVERVEVAVRKCKYSVCSDEMLTTV